MPDELLTSSEVAKMFRVHPKTVTRWAEDGLIEHTRTPGGHRRYPAGPIRRLLKSRSTEGAQ